MRTLYRILLPGLIIALVLSACGGDGEKEGTEATSAKAAATVPAGAAAEQPTATAPAAPASAQPTATSPAAPTQEATAETGDEGLLGDLLNLGALQTNPQELSGTLLQSYRVRAEWTTEPKPGSDTQASSFKFEEAHTQDPLAQQTTFAGDDGTATTMIQIGDTLWMQSGDQWIEVSSDDMSSSLDSALFSLNSAMSGLTGDAKLVGKEQINGVEARHYAFDESMWGTAVGTYEKIKGEVWVAEEGEYTVKYTFDAEDAKATYHWSWEVFDINTPFTIEPPADAQGARKDVPLMADATDRSTFGSMTTYQSASDLTSVVDFYKEQMPGQGWSYDASSEMMSDQFAILSFTKEGETISITVTPNDEGGTTVMITAGE